LAKTGCASGQEKSRAGAQAKGAEPRETVYFSFKRAQGLAPKSFELAATDNSQRATNVRLYFVVVKCRVWVMVKRSGILINVVKFLIKRLYSY